MLRWDLDELVSHTLLLYLHINVCVGAFEYAVEIM